MNLPSWQQMLWLVTVSTIDMLSLEAFCDLMCVSCSVSRVALPGLFTNRLTAIGMCMTLILRSLHWLPIEYHSIFEKTSLCTNTFKQVTLDIFANTYLDMPLPTILNVLGATDYFYGFLVFLLYGIIYLMTSNLLPLIHPSDHN